MFYFIYILHRDLKEKGWVNLEQIQHFIKNEPLNPKEICVQKGIFLLVFFIALNFPRLWFVGVRLVTNKRSVKISKDRKGRISYFYSVVVIVFSACCLTSSVVAFVLIVGWPWKSSKWKIFPSPWLRALYMLWLLSH